MVGPPKLLFFFQKRENAAGDIDEKAPSELFLSDGNEMRLRGKCMYFVRYRNQDIDRDTKNPELEMGYGEIIADSLQCLHWNLQKVFIPALDAQDWGRSDPLEVKEYLGQAAKFNEILVDASNSMQGGIELRKLEKRFMVENKQQAYMRASQDPEILSVYESVMESWCDQCESILMEGNETHEVDDLSGPDSEFEFWRNRMAKFNSVAEQLKMKEHRCVIGVIAQNRTGIPSPIYRRWKAVDNMITDCLNEAKDNVKYLSILEKYTECLYTGTPASIIESLPALISNTKMMLTIAKYYGTSERMTKLFSKITNQMIVNCKNSINRPVPNGPIVRLWDQDIVDLLDRLKQASRLFDTYQQQYRAAKEKLALQPKGKQFDFPENKIFEEFDQFNKRVQKLIIMFTTIQQFSTLAVSSIEGMETLILAFSDIMKEFKRKPYDLLDYTKSAFNRDFLEYTVNIADLEQQVQNFINHSFENIISTEQALALLRKFETLLVRDILRTTLESKYDVIFQNYGQDLEIIQRLYETHKAAPPTVRNVPPVMGNILWAQQLLHRVEDPMRRFKASSTSLMQNSKDAKRIIKMYNKVARALIEFETLWHNAWIKSVEAARSGLQATLIIRHPRTGRLFVNFDREILQLIAEAKGLERAGIDIPENARMVLSHEEKLKSYYNQLAFALKEYDRVVAMVIPVVRPLLKIHLEDLDMKIQPGMVHLTWQSMNIDSYLQKIHAGLSDFEGLVRKVNDIMERVDRNIKIVSRSLLIDLPSNQSFTLEQFVQLQEKVTRVTSSMLEFKNIEIGKAIQDVIHLISFFPIQPMQHVNKSDIDVFWRHHSRIMYLAFLNCTKQSFFALKNRLKSRTSTGLFWVERPFFDVDVELAIPAPAMNPSLEEIQISINRCALNILRCSKKMLQWPQVAREKVAEDNSFHFLIGQDYQIVAVCLMLTGAVESVKKQVLEYLQTFLNFDFLWKADKDMVLGAFIASSPALDDYDQEMSRYEAIDAKIRDIPTVHNLGCLCLHTGPLKSALQREVLMWKELFSNHLRKAVQKDVVGLLEFFSDLKLRLNSPVSNVDSARDLLFILKEVRVLETEMACRFDPVYSAYQLLAKHAIRLDKEEMERASDMESEWSNITKLAQSRTHELYQKQNTLWADLKSAVTVLEQQVSSFRSDFLENGPMVENILPLEAAERMRKYKSLFQEYQNTWLRYREGVVLFGRPVKNISDLEKTAQELELLDELYSLYVNVLESINEYNSLPFSSYSSRMDSIESVMNMYQSRCNQMPLTLRDWRAYGDLKDMIDGFLSACPILRLLSSRAIRQRHWRQIQDLLIVYHEIDMENLFLRDVLNMDLAQAKHQIDDLCYSASKELEIETRLDSLKTDWAETKFEFQNFKNRGPVILRVSVLSDILDKCNLSTSELGRMISQKHSIPFHEAVQSWIIRLSSVSDMIEAILILQPLWIHLECIFSNVEMVKHFPLEAKRFTWVDKAYMKYISKVFETPNVLECCDGYEGMKTTLSSFKEQLEISQKSIASFMDSKRAIRPRLYFVSDRVLLEMLCEEHDLGSISHYLKYVFFSLSRLQISKEQKATAKAMISDDFEEILFLKAVEYQGNTEEFLLDLEYAMQSTIKSLMTECCVIVDNTSVHVLFQTYPSQVCVTSLQILWTRRIEEAIGKTKSDKKALVSTQQACCAIVSDAISLLNLELSVPNRRCIEAIIISELYKKSITDELIRTKVRDIKDFEWQRQRRFYLIVETSFPEFSKESNITRRQSLAQLFPDSFKWDDVHGECGLTILDFKVAYGYEFIGCKERLAISPVSDRCSLCICQAMQSYLACALLGSTGTGKTSTIKDFACTLGKYLVILKCSELMCYKDLERIMKGLAASGLWGMFDDFTKISSSLLSVFAYQMSSVLNALRERKKEFFFTDAHNLALNAGCYFLMTSNLSVHSIGRDRIPENLKSLFRCFSCSEPSILYISHLKLSAYGFEESVTLAKVMDIFYSICKDRFADTMSSFDTRSMLLVIQYAHLTKRDKKEKPEKQILAQALRDVHCCQLPDSKIATYLAILGDAFPEVVTEAWPKHGTNAIVQNLLDSADLLGIKIEVREQTPAFLGKILQMQQMVFCRNTFGAIGPAGSGKSLAIQILSLVTGSGPRVQCNKIYPCCLTTHELFGGLNSITSEWEDGILPVILRAISKSSDFSSWVVFDGHFTSWIELVTFALDEALIFHMGNGDRLSLTSNVKFAFESDSMINLSPAAAARIEFVYFPQDCTGYEMLITSWLNQRQQQTLHLKRLLLSVVSTFGGSRWTKRLMNSTGSSLNNSFTSMVKRMLDFLDVVFETYGEFTDKSELCSKRLAFFAICWSFGSLNDEEERKQFDVEIRKIVEVEIQPPADSICFSYHVVQGEWQPWILPNDLWKCPDDLCQCISSIVVPTTESEQAITIMSMLLFRQVPCLLTGATGVGKSLYALNCVSRLKISGFSTTVHHCSYACSPKFLRGSLELSLEKRYGNSFGALGGKKRIFLIEDIHVTQNEKFGSKEMIRQLLQEKGYYDLMKVGKWKQLVDHSFSASMTIASDRGARLEFLPARLGRLFFPVHVLTPNCAVMEHIFGPMFKHYYSPEQMGNDIGSIISKLCDVTISVWGKICDFAEANLPPSFSYVYTARSLFTLLEGMMKCDRDLIVNRDFMLRLWIHECKRTFSDALSTADSQQFVNDTIFQNLEEAKLLGGLSTSTGAHRLTDSTNVSLKDSPRPLRPAAMQARGIRKTNIIDLRSPIYFCAFSILQDKINEYDDSILPKSQVSYELTAGLESVKLKLQELLVQQNLSPKNALKFEVILFPYAIEQVLKISRVLTTRGGHCLLYGGVGKKTLTKLAAITVNQQIEILDPAAPCDTHQFFSYLADKLKTLDTEPNAEAEGLIVLITRSSLANLEFWTCVGWLLSMTLKREDELEPSCTSRGSTTQAVDCVKGFDFALLEMIYKKLHIVFCLGREEELFDLCEKIPIAIKLCQLIYFTPWSTDSMDDLAKHIVNVLDLAPSPPLGVLEQLASCLPAIFQDTIENLNFGSALSQQADSRTRTYITFVDYLRNIYCSQYRSIHAIKSKIELSIETLQSIQDDIEFLKNENEDFEIALNDNEQLTESLLDNISKQSHVEEKKRADLQVLQSSIKTKQNAIRRAKEEIDKKVNHATPALIEANTMLQRITAKDLQSLKGLKAPPSVVKVVFDIAFLLLNRPISRIQVVEEKGQMFYKDSFSVAAAVVFEPSFIEEVLSFSKDSITDESIELMQPYLQSPLFSIEMAKKVSVVSYALSLWIKAMVVYHEISSAIQPQLEALWHMESDLGSLEMKLAAGVLDANMSHAEIESMQTQILQAVEEKKTIQNNMDLTLRKIQNANNLLASLDEHSVVWKQRITSYLSEINCLPGNSALAAVLFTFCPPQDKKIREKICKGAESVLISRNMEFSSMFSLSDFYLNNHEMAQMRLNQVISKELTNNVVLLQHSHEWPLIFDPQGQASRWLQFKEKENGLRRVTADRLDCDYLRDCCEIGAPLMVEDFSERINANICWIISKLSLMRGKGCKFSLGYGKEFDISQSFRLYLITNDLKMKQVSSLNGFFIPVLNFFHGEEDLLEQLLNLVLLSETPGSAAKRQSIFSELALHEKDCYLKDQEIIDTLSRADGSLVNNAHAIEGLAAAARPLTESRELLRKSQESSLKLLIVSEEIKKLIESGALLYQLAVDMQTVSSLYSTSLHRFLAMFKSAIDLCIGNSTASGRISMMTDELMLTMSRILTTGLFEQHQLLFLLLLAFRMQINSGLISKEQVDCFASNGTPLSDSTRRKPYNWIPDNAWSICLQSSLLIPAFRDLPDSVQRFGDHWKSWCDADTPESTQLPEISSVRNGRLDKLNVLILIRAFRTDRLKHLVKQYVFDTLGSKYNFSITGNMEICFAASSYQIPLLCIYAAGSEPNRMIQQLSKKLRKTIRFVTLGDGQETFVRHQMEMSISLGSWIVMENIQTSPGFMVDIENSWNYAGSAEPDFRLWILIPSDVNISLRLMHISIKICFDAPVGLKLVKDCLDQCTLCFGSDFEETTSWQFKSILLMLCLFHNAVHNRSMFGKLGWSQPYEIHSSDFFASAQILQGIRDDVQKKIKESHWEKSRYLIAEIFYGGQVTDDLDRRILTGYANHLFNSSVLEPNKVIFKQCSVSEISESGQSLNQVLERLALANRPESIGLPAGFEFASNFQSAQYLISILGQIMSSYDLPKSITEQANEFQVIQSPQTLDYSAGTNLAGLLAKLPPAFGPSLGLAKGVSPIDSVFKQEIEKMQSFREAAVNTLNRLRLINDGMLHADDESKSALEDIKVNKLPRFLSGLYSSATSISNWLDVLLLHHEQCSRWLDKGRPNTYWLGGFERPAVMIGAIRQEAARSHRNIPGWALEDIVVYAEVTRFETALDVKGPAEDGVYAHGTFIHNGATWNKKDMKLVESSYSALLAVKGGGISGTLLPVLYIGAIPRNLLKLEDIPAFECPLYGLRVPNSRPICYISMKSVSIVFFCTFFLPNVESIRTTQFSSKYLIFMQQDDSTTKWILQGVHASCHRD